MTSSRITEIRTLASDKALTRKDAQAFITELCDEVVKLQRRRDANTGPSLAEVMTYAREIGLNSGEPEKFHDYHQARGWKMGKTASAPMRDWRAAMRLWKRNGKSSDPKTKETSPPAGWPEFLKAKRYNHDGEFKHAPEWMRLEFATWKKEAGRKVAVAPNLL